MLYDVKLTRIKIGSSTIIVFMEITSIRVNDPEAFES